MWAGIEMPWSGSSNLLNRLLERLLQKAKGSRSVSGAFRYLSGFAWLFMVPRDGVEPRIFSPLLLVIPKGYESHPPIFSLPLLFPHRIRTGCRPRPTPLASD